MAATKDYVEDEQYDEGEYDEDEIAEPQEYVPPSANTTQHNTLTDRGRSTMNDNESTHFVQFSCRYAIATHTRPSLCLRPAAVSAVRAASLSWSWRLSVLWLVRQQLSLSAPLCSFSSRAVPV